MAIPSTELFEAFLTGAEVSLARSRERAVCLSAGGDGVMQGTPQIWTLLWQSSASL